MAAHFPSYIPRFLRERLLKWKLRNRYPVRACITGMDWPYNGTYVEHDYHYYRYYRIKITVYRGKTINSKSHMRSFTASFYHEFSTRTEADDPFGHYDLLPYLYQDYIQQRNVLPLIAFSTKVTGKPHPVLLSSRSFEFSPDDKDENDDHVGDFLCNEFEWGPAMALKRVYLFDNDPQFFINNPLNRYRDEHHIFFEPRYNL